MSGTSTKQQTFPRSVENFLFDRMSKGRATKTVEFYRSELSLFYIWLGKPLEVENLSPDILRRYFVDLATHRNKGGVHCSYRVLKAYLNWYDEEYEPTWKNPIIKVKIKPNHTPPLKEISLDDIQKMLEVCSDRMKLRDTAILKCLVDSGCRATEFLSLNVEDINFSTGAVQIRHGKGDKARITWLGKSARKALQDYLDSRETNPSSPLWLNDTDERLKFYGLRMLIIRLCKRAGIKEKGLHAFRRTFALTLYRKGIDILSISRLLGHTNIEVTKRYLNIGNEDLQKAHNLASPADML